MTTDQRKKDYSLSINTSLAKLNKSNMVSQIFKENEEYENKYSSVSTNISPRLYTKLEKLGFHNKNIKQKIESKYPQKYFGVKNKNFRETLVQTNDLENEFRQILDRKLKKSNEKTYFINKVEFI
jgi:hypothetical protein